MKKALQYLVIHCTATPEGREVSAADIRRWHTSPPSEGGRGWKQVGYTDLIHLDGTVERLVGNNEDAFVDPWEITNGAAGYNGVSRHIVYAGGVASDGKTPKDTRTRRERRSHATLSTSTGHTPGCGSSATATFRPSIKPARRSTSGPGWKLSESSNDNRSNPCPCGDCRHSVERVARFDIHATEICGRSQEPAG